MLRYVYSRLVYGYKKLTHYVDYCHAPPPALALALSAIGTVHPQLAMPRWPCRAGHGPRTGITRAGASDIIRVGWCTSGKCKPPVNPSVQSVNGPLHSFTLYSVHGRPGRPDGSYPRVSTCVDSWPAGAAWHGACFEFCRDPPFAPSLPSAHAAREYGADKGGGLLRCLARQMSRGGMRKHPTR